MKKTIWVESIDDSNKFCIRTESAINFNRCFNIIKSITILINVSQTLFQHFRKMIRCYVQFFSRISVMNVTNFRRFVSFHDKRRAINKKKNFRIFNRFFFQNLKTDATHVHRFLIDAFSKYTKSMKISNSSLSVFSVTSTKKNWIDDCVKFFITIDFDEMRRWIETIKKI